MILSAHSSNGGPYIARPEPLTTRKMLKLLRKRLEAIAQGKIAKSDGSVRRVHKLRVGTRKAIAALAVCEPLLVKADARRIKKLLEAKRKALGQVREWDVLISHVLCTPRDEKAELRCDLLFHLANERKEAWRDARKVWAKSSDNDQFDETLKHAKRNCGLVTAHDLLRRALREPLQQIRKGMPAGITSSTLDMKALHQFRIACKSLRYLLEFRGEITGPAAKSSASLSSLELLNEMQQRLGDLHDLSTRPKRLRSGNTATSKKVEEWLQTAAEQAEQRLPAELDRYLNWQTAADIEGALASLES